MTNGDWLTVHEAAALAGYHPDHIRRLIRAGEVSARKFGPVWAVSQESLVAYLSRMEIQGERRGPKSGQIHSDQSI
jgi:excisionase family DNA binding protein